MCTEDDNMGIGRGKRNICEGVEYGGKGGGDAEI